MGGEDAGDTPPGRSHPEGPRRIRRLLLWSGLAVLLIVAFLAALGAVQRTFYSAGGFVTAYVQAIAAGDVRDALAMPGADPSSRALTAQGLPARPSRELLRADVLPRLTNIRVASDEVLSSGEHRVVVRADADGHPVGDEFTVKQTGSVLGLLPTWSFSRTPLAVAHLDVLHSDTFRVAGHTVDPAASASQRADRFGAAADYLVFAPARYSFSGRSRYVSAAPVVSSPRAGETTDVAVDAQPTAAFTAAVTDRLHAFLDGCARQQVLQPAGCPFGVDIADRVQGLPSWRIVRYPPVRLQAGASGWTMARAPGVAHLSATIQSLFDGTVAPRETDEPFDVSLSRVTIRPDGSLDIVVAP